MNRSSSFLFDADFFNTESAIILEDACKSEGVLAYIKILCYLRKAEDHSLTNNPQIISKLLKVSKKIIEKVIKVSLENNLFFEKDERIFSKEILEDVSKLEAKKTKLQENALKRWGSDNNNQKNNPLKSGSESDAKALQLQCKSQDKEKEKVKDKVKESKGELLRGEIDNLEIPKQWNEVEVKEALKVWTEYHEKDLKLPYKSITPIKALLTSLEKSRPSTELVVFAINYAMAHQWQGVSLYPSVVQAFEGSKAPKTARQIEQEERERILNEWDATAFELEHPELYANDGGAQ